jgi:hypothetical protein
MNFLITCYGYLRGIDIKPYSQTDSLSIIHYNGTEATIVDNVSEIMQLGDNEHIEIRYKIDDKMYHKVYTDTTNILDELQIISNMNCRKISRLIIRAELINVESSQLSSETESPKHIGNVVDVTDILYKYSCNNSIEPNVILVNNIRLPDYAKSFNCNVLCVTQCVNDDIDIEHYELW